DFSTAAARRRACEDEVRLNARLAADVYLGVVPLVVDAGGGLALSGRGRVVDWLVEMRRLDERHELGHRLRRGLVGERDLGALGRTLARFFAVAARVPRSGAAYRRRLPRDIRATRRVLAEPRYGLPGARLHAVEQALLAVLRAHVPLFDARVR